MNGLLHGKLALKGVAPMERKPKKNNDRNMLPVSHFHVLGFPVKEIVTDPQGSYTGVPVDLNDKPTQDADDL